MVRTSVTIPCSPDNWTDICNLCDSLAVLTTAAQRPGVLARTDAPASPPSFANEGHIHIEVYETGTAYWTKTTNSWSLVWSPQHPPMQVMSTAAPLHWDSDAQSLNIPLPSAISDTREGNRIARHTSGDGKQVSINETITSVSDVIEGNLIGRYKSEDGMLIDIDETITTLTGTLSEGMPIGVYRNEFGQEVSILMTWPTFSQDPDTLEITVTYPDGQQQILKVGENVVSSLDARFVASATQGCGTVSVQLTDTSTATGCTIAQHLYEISSDGGATWSTIGASMNTQVNLQPGAYKLRLTVTCDNGNTDVSDPTDICVGEVTITNATATPPSLTLGGTVLLQAFNSTDGCCTIDGTSHRWEVSKDGGATWTTIASLFSTTHTPDTAGTHLYRYTITCSDSGCSDSRTLTVPVAAAGTLEASFTVNTDIGCAPLTVNVTDTSTAVGCTITNHLYEISSDGGTTWINVEDL